MSIKVNSHNLLLNKFIKVTTLASTFTLAITLNHTALATTSTQTPASEGKYTKVVVIDFTGKFQKKGLKQSTDAYIQNRQRRGETVELIEVQNLSELSDPNSIPSKTLHDLQLQGKVKIIAVGHGEPGSAVIKDDRRKYHYSSRDIARFIKSNTTLTHLTFSAHSCSGGLAKYEDLDDPSKSTQSFAKQIFDDLAAEGITAQVKGRNGVISASSDGVRDVLGPSDSYSGAYEKVRQQIEEILDDLKFYKNQNGNGNFDEDLKNANRTLYELEKQYDHMTHGRVVYSIKYGHDEEHLRADHPLETIVFSKEDLTQHGAIKLEEERWSIAEIENKLNERENELLDDVNDDLDIDEKSAGLMDIKDKREKLAKWKADFEARTKIKIPIIETKADDVSAKPDDILSQTSRALKDLQKAMTSSDLTAEGATTGATLTTGTSLSTHQSEASDGSQTSAAVENSAAVGPPSFADDTTAPDDGSIAARSPAGTQTKQEETPADVDVEHGASTAAAAVLDLQNQPPQNADATTPHRPGTRPEMQANYKEATLVQKAYLEHQQSTTIDSTSGESPQDKVRPAARTEINESTERLTERPIELRF